MNILLPLKRKTGILRASVVEVSSLDVTDHILFSAVTEDGTSQSQEQACRLFMLGGFEDDTDDIPAEQTQMLRTCAETNLQQLASMLKKKDNVYFSKEVDKLNRWAEDRIFMAEKELRDTKSRIQELNRLARTVTESEEQLEIQKKLRELNRKQGMLRQDIFDVEDQIADQRDHMIDEIEKRMHRKLKEQPIFTIYWTVI